VLLTTRTAEFSLANADTLGRGRVTGLVGAHLVNDQTVVFAPRSPIRYDAESRSGSRTPWRTAR
jgi:hypothetical protein